MLERRGFVAGLLTVFSSVIETEVGIPLVGYSQPWFDRGCRDQHVELAGSMGGGLGQGADVLMWRAAHCEELRSISLFTVRWRRVQPDCPVSSERLVAIASPGLNG